MALVEVKVPDIGDFKDVAVIELLVKPGDTVAVDQSLITVESDKASMEIPSSHAGVVRELKVALGDKVSEGSVIALLEAAAGDVAAPTAGASSSATASTGGAPAAAASAVPAASVGAGSGGPPMAGVSMAQSSSGNEPLRAVSGAAIATAAAASAGTAATAAKPATAYTGAVDHECDVLVLGGGPGGYSAAFRAADLGLKVVLVERYATLGGVCLNVGCIPSKALLHVAAVIDEARHLAAAGVTFGEPTVDVAALRAHKDKVIGKLTAGLAGMAKARKVTVLRGYGAFVGPHHIAVEETTGSGQDKTGRTQVVAFKRAIIAAGSQAVRLPFLPDDPRVIDSTGALALEGVPQRLLVVGGGIIGLEMGTVYSTLGARLEVVEMTAGLMPGADRDLVKVWQKMNAHRFDAIRLQTKCTGAEATAEGIRVRFEGPDGAVSEGLYDRVLQAVGRSPNGRKIAAERAGVAVSERGFIPVDVQMRTNVPHIFAIGDIVGQPMLAHKAVHEGHVAAEVIAGELLGDDKLARTAFDARVIPSVAYTDPEIAWVGLTEEQAKAQGIAVHKGLFPWAASGRAIANGRDEGFTKLLFDAATGRIVGGGIVGQHAGDMIGEVALAIEMGADAVDIGRTVHPHPTLGETIGLAAEAAHGACTDLPPVRRHG
ncbi:dihydrolipoyl dehydrogenase [Tepidimonas taiwanensis]|uniref:dihydrolipoyl dehydrogenase n=1 Tax=Tepidimonas taiwanensis TaxID=307486 RepID=UPI0007341DC5|nr:dihydrolipoyl dehydrogenase [Tepidimonas taiwanensis]MCX7694025.1 dihydrolipoyl dehydrogenase [Tepidimonas taiwanensis]